jgi:MarR family transcriptional regulator, lower aerobic nicotinate degradation pathway regulator
MKGHNHHNLEPFDERPGHLIRRLQQIALALFMEQAKAFDVTPVQYAAIFAVNDHPGMDQTALSNAIAFDRSTIGDVVTRLERKKLIKRRDGAADKRTKSLYITAAGRRLISDIEPAVAATQRLILAPLPATERGAFMRMLRRLVHLNNEHSRAPRRPPKPVDRATPPTAPVRRPARRPAARPATRLSQRPPRRSPRRR